MLGHSRGLPPVVRAKSCCLACVGVYTPPPLPGLIRDTPCGHGANSRDFFIYLLFIFRNKEKCTGFVGKTRLNVHPEDVIQRSSQKIPPLGDQEAAMLACYTALWTSDLENDRWEAIARAETCESTWNSIPLTPPFPSHVLTTPSS